MEPLWRKLFRQKRKTLRNSKGRAGKQFSITSKHMSKVESETLNQLQKFSKPKFKRKDSSTLRGGLEKAEYNGQL